MPVCGVLLKTGSALCRPLTDFCSVFLGIPEAVFDDLCSRLDSSHQWRGLVPGADQALKLDIQVKAPRELVSILQQSLCRARLSLILVLIQGTAGAHLNIDVFRAQLLATFEAKSAMLPCAVVPFTVAKPGGQSNFTFIHAGKFWTVKQMMD